MKNILLKICLSLVCFTNSFAADTISVAGKIFFDKNADCTFQTAEYGVENWIIIDQLTGHTAISNSKGDFVLTVYNDSMDLQLLKNNQIQNITCPNFNQILLINKSGKLLDSVGLNIPIACSKYCHLFDVNIIASQFEKCKIDNSVIVKFSNQSCDTATTAILRIEIDTTFIDSIIYPFVFTNDITNLYFNLGTIPPFKSGEINFKVRVKCNAIIGTSSCIRAYINPSTNCFNLPLNSASLTVNYSCNSDTIYTELKNTSGIDMGGFGIVKGYEEEIFQFKDSFKLKNNESKILKSLIADNATFTTIVDQDINHPYRPILISHNELCNLKTSSKTNSIINHFSRFDERPEYDEECVEINHVSLNAEKSVVPKGFSSNSYTATNAPLEYRIDFKNIFGDSIKKVVILDTLDNQLDIKTFVPLSASHKYSIQVLDFNILKIVFDTILLLDTTHSKIEYSGYFKFKIAPKLNIPLKSKIVNRVSVYMNNHNSILSNFVSNILLDTIFVKNHGVNSIDNAHIPQVYSIYPNPANEFINIFFEDKTNQNSIQIIDLKGSLKLNINLINDISNFQIPIEYLSPGSYILNIYKQHVLLISKQLQIH